MLFIRNYVQRGLHVGMLYGPPKVHKANTALRPILSEIRTVPYNLSKYLVPVLRPISSSSLVISGTLSFIDNLRNLKLNTNDVYMASFDISSLFTNDPLGETIGNSTSFQ